MHQNIQNPPTKALRSDRIPLSRKKVSEEFEKHVRNVPKAGESAKKITDGSRKYLALSVNKYTYNNGNAWEACRDKDSTMEKMQKRNFRELISKFKGDGLNPEEKDFLSKFISSDFYIAHYSENKIEEGKAFFSRKVLEERKIDFPVTNTKQSDIEHFATHGNVFFSMEIGNDGKDYSRFGKYKHLFKTDDHQAILTNASCSLNDLAENRKPSNGYQQTSEKIGQEITNTEYSKIKQYAGKYTYESPTDLTYRATDMKIALALNIIYDLRQVGKKDTRLQQRALSVTNAKDMNALARTLYRTQVMVPGVFVSRLDKISKPRESSSRCTSKCVII